MGTQGRRPMEPGDLTRIKFVGDAQIAPDGSRVAFVVTTLSEEKDEYLSSIWVVDTSGGEPKRLTSGPRRDTAPRWSPDGKRIAFVSEREPKQKPQLYVIPIDGGEATRLTQMKNGVEGPEWSPDGTRLAFISRVGGWEEPESEEEKQKSKPARVITTQRYKLNGEGFTYDRRPHLFVVAADGGEAGQITDGDFVDSDLAWAPDSRSLAFVSSRHDNRDYDNATDVWLVPVDGGEPRRLTDTSAWVWSPAFSPDGRHIAYAGHRYLNQSGRNTRIYQLAVDGGTTTCLTAELDRNCHEPRWSGNGEWIGFAVDERGNVPLYRLPATGGSPEPILSGERQVTSWSVSSDGRRIAFAATDPVAPTEIFVCAADGGDERQLTDLNRAWRAETELARPERLPYQRAGLDLDCWVLKPFGFEPGRRYPALLSIHGGPHAQYGNTFFDEFQVYAGAGYAVIYTNPRGSQGYGEDVTRAVIGDWGGGDYEDVMAGLDEALRRCDFIDPDRLGVLGGSYGGFMTTWTVGHTDRFKAACSERAVNDISSFFGTSDIGHFFTEWQSGYLPWENPSWYVEHSPLTYAQLITTPLLILHSEQDLRCPVEQGEQLFIALKRLRKETMFVRFPDETHELSRSGKPRHRLERFRFILDWFAKYLRETKDVKRKGAGRGTGAGIEAAVTPSSLRFTFYVLRLSSFVGHRYRRNRGSNGRRTGREGWHHHRRRLGHRAGGGGGVGARGSDRRGG